MLNNQSFDASRALSVRPAALRWQSQPRLRPVALSEECGSGVRWEIVRRKIRDDGKARPRR